MNSTPSRIYDELSEQKIAAIFEKQRSTLHMFISTASYANDVKSDAEDAIAGSQYERRPLTTAKTRNQQF